MNKKFVLTGGLVSGKSTILNELSRLGYATYSELYQTVIDENDLHPRQNPEEFIQKWFEKKICQYKQANEELCFFERDVIDPLAVYLFLERDIPEDCADLVKKYYYTNPVFLIEPVPLDWLGGFWPRDVLSRSESYLYHNILRDMYLELGYKICSVPPFSVEERVNLILDNIPPP